MQCFLSYSSKDNHAGIDTVKNSLGNIAITDANSFRSGSLLESEMKSHIERCDIFVAFLSNNSLDSKPVLFEIECAKALLDEGKILEILPINIDAAIMFDDHRIPEWLQRYYIKPVRPNRAIGIINQSLIEASWRQHAELEEKHRIFVGRNDIIKDFEQRLNDHAKGYPTAIFASGFKEIGRKTFIAHALDKTNLKKLSSPTTLVTLSMEDGIEDFITKLAEALDSDISSQHDLLTEDMPSKIHKCLDILQENLNDNSIILIDDTHCIVRRDGTVAEWFVEICRSLPRNGKKLCITTASRPDKRTLLREPKFYFVDIPEMEKFEREGLFHRHCTSFGIDLSNEQFLNFASLLKGFPLQARYAAELIREYGADLAFSKHSNEIAKYSQYKANIYVRAYEENPVAMGFLSFLSQLDFFSLDFIQNIKHPKQDEILQYLEQFLADHICEPIGGGQIHYYRVSEVISDFILRGRLGIDEIYMDALKKNLSEIQNAAHPGDFDLSQIRNAAQQALASGEPFPERLLIPAHILSTIRNQYNLGNHRSVVRLADQAITNAANMDKNIVNDFRYFLCQSLARLADKRFLEEVQEIKSPEHNYLMGFYYRIVGRLEEAKSRLANALTDKKTEQRSRGELVTVLQAMEEYDEALHLAKDNHQKYPANPYFLQSYVTCLLNQEKTKENGEAIEQTIENFETIKSLVNNKLADEILGILKARHEAVYGRVAIALTLIDDVMKSFPGKIHPILAKLEIACEVEDATLINEVLPRVKELAGQGRQHQFVILKAEFLAQAISGDIDGALRNVSMSKLPEAVANRLTRRIERRK